METSNKITIDGIDYPQSLQQYLLPNGNLTIEGYEFPFDIISPTNFGCDWIHLGDYSYIHTEDVEGNFHRIDFDNNAETFSLFKPQ